jgi:hypothetical protein
VTGRERCRIIELIHAGDRQKLTWNHFIDRKLLQFELIDWRGSQP